MCNTTAVWLFIEAARMDHEREVGLSHALVAH
jgi:hypothetical protein